MQFNDRVLEEACDEANPALERVKFLAITASNLDEFVEVRVAGLLQQVEHGIREPGPDGKIPEEVLKELAAKIHEFVGRQYECWRDLLVPALVEEAIRVLSRAEMSPEAREYIENFYSKTVEPLLTPVTVDPAHPFPHVLNKALCVAFLLKRKRRNAQTFLGVVTVPRALPRLVLLPSEEGKVEYVFLHDVVHAFAERLYHGYEVLSAAPFRVTRNSNLYLEKEESRSLLDTVDTQLHRRRKGAAVRMEIEAGANREIVDRLQANFRLEPWQMFHVNGPPNLSRLFHMYDQTPRPDLKFKPLTAYSERASYSPLFVAPLNLGKSCLTLINREAAHARAGRPAFIFAKVNALLDERIIEALYRASQAGVQIELVVRGACALRPGLRGISSRIRVRSVIGRFLEHSRVFVFGNGGTTETYLGSADWMHRNIYERVEVMYHLRDPELAQQVFAEVLQPYLADTAKTRFLLPDGKYIRSREATKLLHMRHGFAFNAQEFLIGVAEGRDNLQAVPAAERPFKAAGLVATAPKSV
jgi:polyphosphate kinase